jgi:hypothetical protein
LCCPTCWAHFSIIFDANTHLVNCAQVFNFGLDLVRLDVKRRTRAAVSIERLYACRARCNVERVVDRAKADCRLVFVSVSAGHRTHSRNVCYNTLENTQACHTQEKTLALHPLLLQHSRDQLGARALFDDASRRPEKSFFKLLDRHEQLPVYLRYYTRRYVKVRNSCSVDVKFFCARSAASWTLQSQDGEWIRRQHSRQ